MANQTPTLSQVGNDVGIIALPHGTDVRPGLPQVNLPEFTPPPPNLALRPGELSITIHPQQQQQPQVQPQPEQQPPPVPEPQPGQIYVHPSLLSDQQAPVLPSDTQVQPGAIADSTVQLPLQPNHAAINQALTEDDSTSPIVGLKSSAEAERNLVARLAAGAASVPMFPATATGLIQHGLGWLGDQIGVDVHPGESSDMLAQSNDALQAVRQAIAPGMKPPEGFLQLAPEMLGGAMIPVGQVTGLAKPLKYVMPGTHDYTAGNVAINAAIPTAIAGTIDHLTGHVGDDPTLVSPAQAAMPQPQPGQVYVHPSLLSNATANAPMHVDNSPTWLQRHMGELVTGAATIAISGALAHRVVTRLRAPATVLGTQAPVETGRVTPMSTRVAQQWIDSEGPSFKFIERTMGKRAALSYENLVQTSTRNAGTAAAIEQLKTGIFPGNSAVRSYPFSKLATDYHALPDDVRKIFDDGIIAETVLQQRRQAAIAGGNAQPYVRSDRLINPATGLQYTEDELRSAIQQLNNIPQLTQMRADYRDILYKTLDYGIEQGYFTNHTAQKFQQANPGYAPLMDGKPRPSTVAASLAEMLDAATTEGKAFKQVGSLMERSNEAFSGVSAPITPMDSLEQYQMGMLIAIQRNTAQREFAKNIEQAIARKQFDNSSKTFAFNNGKPAGDNVIVYKDGGISKSLEINDPAIAQALRFDPHVYGGIFNGMRHVVQQGTTGMLAPLFGIKAMVYDAMAQEIGRPKGQGIGVANRVLQYMTNKAIGVPGDPTAVLTQAVGMPRALAAQWKYDMAMRLRGALDNGLGKSSWLGDYIDLPNSAIEKLSDALLNSYIDSTMSIVNRFGGINAGFAGAKTASNPASVLHEIVLNSGGPLHNVMSAFRQYKYLLESMHNAARLENIARSEAINDVRQATKAGTQIPSATEQALRGVIGDTRRVPGDFSRTGNGVWARGTTTKIPYANTTIQGMRGLLRAAKERPGTTAMGLLNAVMIPTVLELATVANMDDESRWQYFNTISQDDHLRSIKMWMPWSKGVHDYQEIPVFPDLQPVRGLTLDLMSQIYGPNMRAEVPGAHVPDNMTMRGLGHMFDMSVPSVLNSTYAAYDMATGSKKPMTFNSWEDLVRQPTGVNTGYDDQAQQDYVAAMSTDMRNLIAGMLGQFGQELNNAAQEGVLAQKRTGDPVQALQESLNSVVTDQWRSVPGAKSADATVSAWNSQREYVDKAYGNLKEILDQQSLDQRRLGSPTALRPGMPVPQILLDAQKDPQFAQAMMIVRGNTQILSQIRSQLEAAKGQERQSRSLPTVRLDREQRIASARLQQAALYERALIEMRRVEQILSRTVYAGQPVDLRELKPAR